jgi:hypothetical protein
MEYDNRIILWKCKILYPSHANSTFTFILTWAVGRARHASDAVSIL